MVPLAHAARPAPLAGGNKWNTSNFPRRGLTLDRQELAARAALRTLRGLDNRILSRLIHRWGSAAAAWEAGPGRWGLPPSSLRRAWEEAWRRTNPEEVLDGLARRGLRATMPGWPGYPPELAGAGGPPLLYARGQAEAAQRPAVAVVGTRRATPYGLMQARRLAARLAQAGLVVASGMALGIDGAAHEGALEAGGCTLAWLGSGLERLYPPQHANLARRIACQGLLLTPFAPEEPPLRHHFPERNRLLAAAVLAVVVVEAPPGSGALQTAVCAAGMGRPVMAVPGRADAWTSAGCLALLRQGAAAVGSAEDVLEELERAYPGWQRLQGLPSPAPPEGPDSQALVDLTPDERCIYDVLALEGAAAAEVAAARLGWPVQRAWAALTGLELKGLVVRVGASYGCCAAERPAKPGLAPGT